MVVEAITLPGGSSSTFCPVICVTGSLHGTPTDSLRAENRIPQVQLLLSAGSKAPTGFRGGLSGVGRVFGHYGIHFPSMFFHNTLHLIAGICAHGKIVTGSGLHSLPGSARQVFTFNADVDACTEIAGEVMRFIQENCALEEADQPAVDLALQEALANAVVHGCKKDPSKVVYCEVSRDANGLVIVVRDPGPGFDPNLVPDPRSHAGRMAYSGRGVLLIRSLMDEVTFANNGAEIRMRKFEKK